MGIFLIISTILFLLLGIIWTKEGWVNFSLKLIFWAMTIFGVYGVLTYFGYLIKV